MIRAHLTGTLLGAAWLATSAHAQSVSKTIIYNFTAPPNGVRPQAELVEGANAILYGTTFTGAANGDGTVYQISPSRPPLPNKEVVLHHFGITTKDGHYPAQPVTLGADGNLYGTTPQGGINDAGIAFALINPGTGNGGWKEVILHRFTGGPDGGSSYSGLVFGPDGALYGTTGFGGANSAGTVFRIARNAQGGFTETVLYSFRHGTDGAYPYSIPVFDAAGNLYGTTLNGGTSDNGTVFRLSPPAQPGGAWTETVLYSFGTGNDGAQPRKGVIFDPAGNLYGTTEAGGAQNRGTVFEVSPPANGTGAWTETQLVSFDFVHGASPGYSTLVRDPATGAIYGTTQIGGVPVGQTSYGTVFRLLPDAHQPTGYAFRVIYTFKGGADGAQPESGLILGSGGELFGTTFFGGTADNGTVFALNSQG